jgi:hypothetical protein
MASLLFLSLSSAALADTLPSFLNSNETTRNLPVPNLPADAYRPAATPLQVPDPGAAAAQPLLMETKINLKPCRSKAARSTRSTNWLKSTNPDRPPDQSRRPDRSHAQHHPPLPAGRLSAVLRVPAATAFRRRRGAGGAGEGYVRDVQVQAMSAGSKACSTNWQPKSRPNAR